MSINAVIPVNNMQTDASISVKLTDTSAAASTAQTAQVSQSSEPTSSEASSTMSASAIKVAVALAGNMSAQQIAEKYGISVAEAQQILDSVSSSSTSSSRFAVEV